DTPIFPKPTERLISDNTRAKNRESMLNLIEDIWITGFLSNVMNEMTSLKLDLAFAEPEKVLQRPALDDYTLPNNAEILKVFDTLNHKLVILGEPGAGKTVLLLQLCELLIQRAREDKRAPIPVVLALSSWAAKQPPFEDWLRDELRARYNQSSRVVDDLVGGEQLLYLLDGLDEVAAEHREACLQAIKAFVEARRVDYVLCSRYNEFKALETRLDVPGEVVIQALKPTQINNYLKGKEFAALRAVMQQYKVIRAFTGVPFMLNTMAVVTRGQTETSLRLDIENCANADDLRDYFLENYLDRRLREKTHPDYPDVQETRERLSWLAWQLVLHDETDFYIENLQPDWLDSETQIRHYLWSTGLMIGLLFGLASVPIIGLINGFVGGLLIGLLVKLTGNLIEGLGTGLVSILLILAVVHRAIGILDWFASVIIGVGILKLTRLDYPQLHQIKVVDSLVWSFKLLGIVTGSFILIVGWLSSGSLEGFTFGVGTVIVLVLLGGFDVQTMVVTRTKPNQGIRRSLLNFVRMTL
ncbi:MAG: NACHT domain-containing protein, partial [Candidatus Methanoperedens sp.]|nr:NACHT domain-containing protein [Candidatus Methanoperedens sp.]